MIIYSPYSSSDQDPNIRKRNLRYEIERLSEGNVSQLVATLGAAKETFKEIGKIKRDTWKEIKGTFQAVGTVFGVKNVLAAAGAPLRRTQTLLGMGMQGVMAPSTLMLSQISGEFSRKASAHAAAYQTGSAIGGVIGMGAGAVIGGYFGGAQGAMLGSQALGFLGSSIGAGIEQLFGGTDPGTISNVVRDLTLNARGLLERGWEPKEIYNNLWNISRANSNTKAAWAQLGWSDYNVFLAYLGVNQNTRNDTMLPTATYTPGMYNISEVDRYIPEYQYMRRLRAR